MKTTYHYADIVTILLNAPHCDDIAQQGLDALDCAADEHRPLDRIFRF